MPQAFLTGQPHLRVMRRQSLCPVPTLRVRPIRPSVLELRLVGDPSIVPQEGESLALCFDDWRLASLRGLLLDLPSLHRWLDRFRSRRSRHRH